MDPRSLTVLLACAISPALRGQSYRDLTTTRERPHPYSSVFQIQAGLIGASKSLARELGKRKITVNVIAPGLIETEMAAHAPAEAMLELIPMRRMGKADEVAKLVRFLASDDAAYITGQVIAIDGGLT